MKFLSRSILGLGLLTVLAGPAALFAQGDPVCTVTPDSLNFGTCWYGEACDLPLTIANTGGGVLNGTVNQASPGFWLRDLSDGHAFSLAAGEELTVWISTGYVEPYSTQYEGIVRLEGDDPVDVPCWSVAQYPPQGTTVECLLYPQTIDFGQVVVGEVSEPIEYKVSNYRYGAMEVNIPPSLDEFLFDWPGQYFQTAWVWRKARFAPQTFGAHICTLTASNACAEEFFGGIVMQGFALNDFPSVEMDTSPRDFGPVLVGDGAVRVVRVENTGNASISGHMTLTGDGYRVADDDLFWGVAAGEVVLIAVYFEPTVTGLSEGTLDLGHPLCGMVDLTGTGTEASARPDVLGIYFEQSGVTDTYRTTQPWEQVTAYLLVVNPSTTNGIGAWECCVEMTGAGVGLQFDLEGDAINVDQAPCFSVGIGGYALQGQSIVKLATLTFLQPDPESVTRFYLHPATSPSVPGVAVYADGLDPGQLIPLDWAKGDEALPVAAVNEELSPVAAPPEATRLLGNHPNPFNPSTTIRFALRVEGPVDLRVFDMSGAVVRTLLAGEVLPAGHREAVWNGRDEAGRAVASGVYFYRLQTRGFSETRRMTLLK